MINKTSYYFLSLFAFGVVLFYSCSSDKTEKETTIEEEKPTAGNDTENSTWLSFNPDVFSVDSTANRLVLNLEENALWYESNTGGLLYKEVTGDFTLSAKVLVRKKSDEELFSDCNICLGGLMARNPDNSNGENYVHLVSGNTPESSNNGTDELGVEHKSTENDTSNFETLPDASSDHELRIQRQGNDFKMYSKALDANDWNLVHTYTRTDLPETLQVGLNIYTAASGNTADLRIIYEDILLEQN